jgi:hypothetical protein
LGSNNGRHQQSRSDECGNNESENTSHLWILAPHQCARAAAPSRTRLVEMHGAASEVPREKFVKNVALIDQRDTIHHAFNSEWVSESRL